jgi:hypothetical protein
MAKDKGKKKPVDAGEQPVDNGNEQPVDGGAVEVQKENPEKPVEKAGRNDYILRLMASRRKAMAGKK